MKYILKKIMIEEIWEIYKCTKRTKYEVSNLGNTKQNNKLFIPEKNKMRYYKCGAYYIHRMVAETFVPNPENKPEIDHIDGNTYNNNVNNLRWVTRHENLTNPITRKRRSLSMIGNKTHLGFKLTEEQRKNLSDAHKGIKSPIKGKHKVWDNKEKNIYHFE